MRYERTGVRDNLAEMFGVSAGGLFEVCPLCFEPLAAMPTAGENPEPIASTAGLPIFRVSKSGDRLAVNGAEVEERDFVEELAILHERHASWSHGVCRKPSVFRYPRVSKFSGNLWFSRWHRELPSGFAAIDLDAWFSCGSCGRLQVFEMVRGGVRECTSKPTTFLRKLAAAVSADAYVVAYTPGSVFVRSLGSGVIEAMTRLRLSGCGFCRCRG